MMRGRTSIRERIRAAYEVLAREFAKFGVVGLTAFLIDLVLYNLLVFGPPGGAEGPMSDIPLRAKIVSTAIATVFAWLGNRYWTFRGRRSTRVLREFALYIWFNIIGLGIALACLGFSRYLLGLDSQLADNVSGNGVGLVLGTVFRFWAYRTFVFTGDRGPTLGGEPSPPADHTDPEQTETGRETGNPASRAGGHPAEAIDT